MIRALYTRKWNERTTGKSGHGGEYLANSATAGFRRRRLQFEDMIYQYMITPGSAQSQQTVSAGCR